MTPLRRFRDLQTQLSALAPYRDTGLAPQPAGTVERVLVAEERLGQRLPTSYRQFLLRYDGWRRFFDGADLLGTAELGSRDYSELAWMAFRATGSPNRAVRRIMKMDDLLVFGVDAQCTTLFAFETCYGAENEFSVVSWVGEVGFRSPSFEHWLVWIAQLCESELADLTEPSVSLGVA